MKTLNDIQIIGIDDERPPMISKKNYIDLFFKLSIKPPLDWCDDFNTLGHKIEPAVKVDKNKINVVVSWVREMDLIPAHLEKIKKTIMLCNQQYMEKMKQKQLAAAQKNASALKFDTDVSA